MERYAVPICLVSKRLLVAMLRVGTSTTSTLPADMRSHAERGNAA